MTGICAEVRVDGPSVCQLAAVSARSGPVTGISRSSTPNDDGTVAEEFTLETDDTVDTDGVETEPVFSYDESTVHRFSRDSGQGCVCEVVETVGCTVRDVQVVDGSVVVTFLASDLQTIRDVVGDLRDAHEGVSVRRLTRSADSGGDSAEVVDLNALTCRQREILETAHELGYFEHPKETSASEIAEGLDIATPTFTEHLAAAQRKLLDELLAHSESSGHRITTD